MKHIINDFINSIDTEIYSQIRASKGDAECRRYLKEHLQKKLLIASVSGLVPFTDVLELNIRIEKLNKKQITLEEFVSDVWNTAYRVGYDMASEQ